MIFSSPFIPSLCILLGKAQTSWRSRTWFFSHDPLSCSVNDHHHTAAFLRGFNTSNLVSEMTYTVSSGTLNSTVPYHTIHVQSALIYLSWKQSWLVPVSTMFFAQFCVDLSDSPPPALPFGRICFVVPVIRKGRESSWNRPWHLGCTLEVFHVHSYQDQFIQPVGPNVFVYLA